jgi:hypothetical protein
MIIGGRVIDVIGSGTCGFEVVVVGVLVCVVVLVVVLVVVDRVESGILGIELVIMGALVGIVLIITELVIGIISTGILSWGCHVVVSNSGTFVDVVLAHWTSVANGK